MTSRALWTWGAWLVLVAALVLRVPTAAAQMAGAVGIPLPDGSLPERSVTVRVVDGPAMGKVVGAPVRLLIDGEERETKTDAEGRAVFMGLRAGASAQVVVAGASGGDLASQPFAIAAVGGTRILLATAALAPPQGSQPGQPGPRGALPPAGAAAAAMPDPRQMSGQARTMEGEPGGSLTIRVLQGALTAPVAGAQVTLVGYAADGSVSAQVAATDAQGQARFSQLDRSGRIAYYAFTALSRGASGAASNAAGAELVDRVAGGPAILDGKYGARMILSGAAAAAPGVGDAPGAPIDDTLWLASQPPLQPEPQTVAVYVRGEPLATIELVEARSGKAVASQPTTAVAPVGANGGDELVVARFSGVAAGAVYYAQGIGDDGMRFRSAPFLAVAGRGVSAEVLATPPLRFRFHLVAAGIEDAQVGMQGEFAFYNLGWAPLAMGVDGFTLTTPRGARGNLLMEGEANASVATPTKDGFALRRPLPPMLTSFQGGFSLPHAHGVMRLEWALPYGAVDSSFLMVALGNATLDVPPGTRINDRVAQDGTKLKVINDIEISPGQSMVMSLRGLPVAPAWRTWLPGAAGLMVLLLLGGASVMAYRAAARGVTVAAAGSEDALAIDELYDRLAALPPGPQAAAERDALTAALAARLAPASPDPSDRPDGA